MDDWKLSHQDRKVDDEFINTLNDECASVFEDGSGKIQLIQGKVHDYLGMTLDCILKVQVKIAMMD